MTQYQIYRGTIRTIKKVKGEVTEEDKDFAVKVMFECRPLARMLSDLEMVQMVKDRVQMYLGGLK
jgi:hypothetical protein